MEPQVQELFDIAHENQVNLIVARVRQGQKQGELAYAVYVPGNREPVYTVNYPYRDCRQAMSLADRFRLLLGRFFYLQRVDGRALVLADQRGEVQSLIGEINARINNVGRYMNDFARDRPTFVILDDGDVRNDNPDVGQLFRYYGFHIPLHIPLYQRGILEVYHTSRARFLQCMEQNMPFRDLLGNLRCHDYEYKTLTLPDCLNNIQHGEYGVIRIIANSITIAPNHIEPAEMDLPVAVIQVAGSALPQHEHRGFAENATRVPCPFNACCYLRRRGFPLVFGFLYLTDPGAANELTEGLLGRIQRGMQNPAQCLGATVATWLNQEYSALLDDLRGAELGRLYRALTFVGLVCVV